jgi:pyrroline-5-carboxylate reductase
MSEELFDAFTALSGSGPAYVQYFFYVKRMSQSNCIRFILKMCAILDALADGALKEGIGKELALKIAAQTMYGTSAMILNDFKHIYQLRDDVCSPGGTTISGLIELDRTQFRYALIKCIEASTRRAKELSNLDGA